MRFYVKTVKRLYKCEYAKKCCHICYCEKFCLKIPIVYLLNIFFSINDLIKVKYHNLFDHTYFKR